MALFIALFNCKVTRFIKRLLSLDACGFYHIIVIIISAVRCRDSDYICHRCRPLCVGSNLHKCKSLSRLAADLDNNFENNWENVTLHMRCATSLITHLPYARGLLTCQGQHSQILCSYESKLLNVISYNLIIQLMLSNLPCFSVPKSLFWV